MIFAYGRMLILAIRSRGAFWHCIMLTIGTLSNTHHIKGFRFASVEIDIPTREVRVAGRVQNCPPKAFELLALLCQAPRTTIERSALIDALWPGGQVISDEALTQAVFRARNALGEHAGLLGTVRGVGVRLNARVVAVEETSAAPETLRVAPRTQPAEIAAPRGTARAVPSRRRTWLPWTMAGVLVLAGLAVLLLRPDAPRPAEADTGVIDKGYGLMAEDVLASKTNTASIIAEALQNDSKGERERARTLLVATHADDPTTPIPALFLALWAGAGGDLARSDEWLSQAVARIGESGGMYLNLFVEYVAAESRGAPEDVIRVAGTLLDIRPNAWRMHSARAHLMEFIGMREAALREISQVEVESLVDRKIALTVADRASMGDVDGAQAILDRLGPDSDPVEFGFISGRVSWSRGDFDSAYRQFSDTANRAYEQARLDVFRRSLIYAAAIDAANGREDIAIAGLERARSALEQRSLIDDIDISLFLAQLHAAAGRHDKARQELDRALAQNTADGPKTILTVAYLTALRLQPEDPPQRPDFFNKSADALWRANMMLHEHDPDAALAALNEARYHGVFQSRLADEARWLELQLGDPVTAEQALDPPYPPMARVMLRRDLRHALEERGTDPGTARP